MANVNAKKDVRGGATTVEEDQFKILECEKCGTRYVINCQPGFYTPIYIWRFCPKCLRELLREIQEVEA